MVLCTILFLIQRHKNLIKEIIWKRKYKVSDFVKLLKRDYLTNSPLKVWPINYGTLMINIRILQINIGLLFYAFSRYFIWSYIWVVIVSTHNSLEFHTQGCQFGLVSFLFSFFKIRIYTGNCERWNFVSSNRKISVTNQSKIYYSEFLI